MKLHCKKADLYLFSKFRKIPIPNFHLYFLSNRDYTRYEAEMKIREKKNEIFERLGEKFKSHVKMMVKGDPVEKFDVEEKYGLIMTAAGCIPKEAVILEI